MGKLRVLAGAAICQILEQHGFLPVRQRGSHKIMQKQLDGSTVTVPVPLLLSIIRQSGLAKSLFEVS